MKKSIKHEWKKASRKITSEISEQIREKTFVLKTLLSSIKIEPTRKNIIKAKALQWCITELKSRHQPPQAKTAKHNFNKEERMSREFFRDLLPRNKNNSKIEALEKVADWDSPPPKNTESNSTTEDVAQEASKYFSHLALPYTATDPAHAKKITKAQNKLLNELGKWGVDERTSKEVGAEITPEEIEKVASHVPLGKSPGPDRLPNILYRAFAHPLSTIMAKVFNKCQNTGKMPKEFNDGIVTILYKKGVRTDVRNYRPITLLNNDYKILTRILAKRMLRIITQCISDNQIGFMPRTFLAESTMLVKLIQAHLDTIDEGGLLVFLDLEKAFDRVSWDFMKKAIKKLRFTDGIQKWMDALYDEKSPPKRVIYANGKLSKPYLVSLGVAQGCPLSPILFTIIIEGFTRLVNASSLKGITIGPHKYLVSHFADDTFGILNGPRDLPLWDSLCDVFYTASNMKENLSKRELLPIGSLKNIDPVTLPGTTWDDKLKKNINSCVVTPGNWLRSLGYPIGNDFTPDDFLKTIYKKAKLTLANIQHISSKTVNGKHNILNACYYGRFRFYLWALEFGNPLNDNIKSDAKIFLWKRNPEIKADSEGSTGNIGKFISKKASPLPWKKGGAGILDWEIHHRAFYAQWILKMFEPRRALWEDIIEHWLGEPKQILIGKLTANDRKNILNKIPSRATYFRRCLVEFWKLQIQPSYNLQNKALQDKAYFVPQPIFHSYIVKANPKLKTTFQALDIKNLGDLFNSVTNLFFTNEEFIRIIKSAAPQLCAALNLANLTSGKVRRTSTILSDLVGQIPTAIKTIMIQGDTEYNENEIVAFTESYLDGSSEVLYGKYSRTQNTLETLRVDSSGYYEPVGVPHDTSTWDTQTEFSKTAIQNKLILGVKNTTYPHNEGWTMEGARDEINLRRSDLSIHRITSTLQQRNTEPPNCQTNWLRYLDPNKPIDWKAVWESIGTPFTNPKDEHTWLIGILHRHLYVRSKQSEESQICRLCKRSKETISHITQDCSKIIAVKSKISELLRKMGLKTSEIDGIRTWVFGFNKEKQLVSHLPLGRI